MKQSLLIVIIISTLLNTSLIYTAPGDKEKKQSVSFCCSNNSHRQEFIANGVTKADISVSCSGNATIAIDVPLSVQKIQLTGSSSGNSSIYLYVRHNPEITNNIFMSSNATFSPMHPIRKYTYHLAALAAIGALAYYFTSEK